MTTDDVAWLSSWPTTSSAFAQACVWAGRIDEIRPGAAPLVATAHDRDEAERRPPSARQAFLRRRLALRRFVAIQTGEPPEAVTVSAEAGGRPRVLTPSGPWHVSTGGRDGWLALALARHRVGVDIEPADGSASPPWNVLAPDESRRLAASPPGRQWHEFVILWTGKEAYFKACGTGLSREPSEITIRPSGDSLTINDRGAPILGRGLTRVVADATSPMRVAVVTLAHVATSPTSPHQATL